MSLSTDLTSTGPVNTSHIHTTVSKKRVQSILQNVHAYETSPHRSIMASPSFHRSLTGHTRSNSLYLLGKWISVPVHQPVPICTHSSTPPPFSHSHTIFSNANLRLFSLPPLLALIILYIVFLQLRLGYGKASKKQDLVFEAVKSGITTGLWLWFFIGAVVMLKYEAGALRLLLAAVGFVVPAVVFWPTLVVAFLAWRRGRTASISLR